MMSMYLKGSNYAHNIRLIILSDDIDGVVYFALEHRSFKITSFSKSSLFLNLVDQNYVMIDNLLRSNSVLK